MISYKLLNFIGKEINICDFQNELEKLGFIVEEEEEIIGEILETESAMYRHSLNENWTIDILFKVTILANTEDESIGASYIKIEEIF